MNVSVRYLPVHIGEGSAWGTLPNASMRTQGTCHEARFAELGIDMTRMGLSLAATLRCEVGSGLGNERSSRALRQRTSIFYSPGGAFFG